MTTLHEPQPISKWIYGKGKANNETYAIVSVLYVCMHTYLLWTNTVPNVILSPSDSQGRIPSIWHKRRQAAERFTHNIVVGNNNPKYIQTHSNSSQKLCFERKAQLKYLWFLRDLNLKSNYSRFLKKQKQKHIHTHIEKNRHTS